MNAASVVRIGSITSLLFLLNFTAAGEIVELQAKKGLRPFEFEPAPSPLPNYLAGAKWSTEGEAIRTMQKPLSPQESQQHIVVPPGFDVQLFAAEPQIYKPITMAWDERGRLWIVETIDYPNGKVPSGKGHDRIVICEDTDHDGRADKFTVFADELNIPTSIVFANGGVIIAQAPDFIFLKDTDGDGKADIKQVLFTGWGIRDTHAGPSNFRWGPDNWIWGTVGYSGFEGDVGGKHYQFGQGIYRFKPDGSALEFIRSSNNNTWGLGFSEEGLLFGSTANGNASQFISIPNRYYEAVSGWAAAVLPTIADSQSFFPITTKVRQVDWHGQYTAGAGHALYTARAFPREFWNRVAFVAEPTGHLIGKFALEPKGSDFTSRNEHTFLASDDEWTAPIFADVGPDGALWVIDWYNYIVQHNPVPIGFTNGYGNAYETPLRDKTHGRIYRVTSTGAAKARQLDLSKASSAELVETLSNNNMIWRMHAQRLLVERKAVDAIPALIRLSKTTVLDAIGLAPGATHALWTLNGLGALDGSNPQATAALNTALRHTSAGVRRAAVMGLPHDEQSYKTLIASRVLEDKNPQVRLAALLAMADMPTTNGGGKAIYSTAIAPANQNDLLIRDAAVAAAAHDPAGFLAAAVAGKTAGTSNAIPGMISIVARHLAEKAPVQATLPILEILPQAQQVNAIALLQGLNAGWSKNQKANFTADEIAKMKSIMASLPGPMRDQFIVLAHSWQATEVYASEMARTTQQLRARMNDPKASDAERTAAAVQLVQLADGPDTIQALIKNITVQASPDLAAGTISAIGESQSSTVGDTILADWANLTPAARTAALGVLVRRGPWTASLLNSVEKGTLRRGDIPKQLWTQMRANSDTNLAQRATKLTAGSEASSSAERQTIITRLLPLANQHGNAARGREIFTTTCAVCHTFNGAGAKIGPDLTGMGLKDRSELLIDILDPNRSVEANYRLWTATTKTGEAISGKLESETTTAVEITDLSSQKHSIQRKDLEKLATSGTSIMPTGFEALPAEDLASLLDYLATPMPLAERK